MSSVIQAEQFAYTLKNIKNENQMNEEYARMHKLDTKQRIAFEVICCTFMLDCIEKMSLHYDLDINNLSGNKRHKKQENHCQQL